MPVTPNWDNLVFGITADRGVQGSSEFRVYPEGAQTRTINNPYVDTTNTRNASGSVSFAMNGLPPGGVIGMSGLTDIGTGAITLSVFVNPFSGSNGVPARILTWGLPGQANTISIIMNSTGNPSAAYVEVYAGSTLYNVGSFGTITNGVFTHLEVSRDSNNTWRLFKDGILLETVTNIPSFTSSQNTCLIGSEYTGSTPVHHTGSC